MEDERSRLISVVEEYIREAYQARSDLLAARQKAHDAEARMLLAEVEQLDHKKNRLGSNLARASVADLRAYHYLFLGTELP